MAGNLRFNERVSYLLLRNKHKQPLLLVGTKISRLGHKEMH